MVVCVSSRSSSVHVSMLMGSVTPSSATWDEAGTALDAGVLAGVPELPQAVNAMPAARTARILYFRFIKIPSFLTR